jgi:hypothetical protein
MRDLAPHKRALSVAATAACAHWAASFPLPILMSILAMITCVWSLLTTGWPGSATLRAGPCFGRGSQNPLTILCSPQPLATRLRARPIMGTSKLEPCDVESSARPPAKCEFVVDPSNREQRLTRSINKIIALAAHVYAPASSESAFVSVGRVSGFFVRWNHHSLSLRAHLHPQTRSPADPGLNRIDGGSCATTADHCGWP